MADIFGIENKTKQSKFSIDMVHFAKTKHKTNKILCKSMEKYQKNIFSEEFISITKT